MANEVPGVPKKKSGCFPFGCGCLFGMVLMLALLAGLSYATFYFGGFLFEQTVSRLYEDQIRPQILQSLPLSDSEKQRVVGELDQLVKDFPNMTMEEKRQAIEAFVDKVAPEGMDQPTPHNLEPTEEPNSPEVDVIEDDEAGEDDTQ